MHRFLHFNAGPARLVGAGVMAALLFLAADAPKLKKIIVGNWETVSVRIELTSITDPTAPSVIEATPDTWADKMRMKPPRSKYLADGSFSSAYIDLSGQVIKEVKGRYKVEGEGLTLTSDDKHYDGLQYRCRVISQDTFQYTTNIDFDNDGERDDKLTGIARRIP